MTDRLQCWTDGACGKYRHGGWAFVLYSPYKSILANRAIWCGPRYNITTNGIDSASVALQFLRDEWSWHCDPISVHTDSSYLKNCFTKGWYKTWERNGWRNSKGEPVANRDLWETLIPLVHSRAPKWYKVGGHKGNDLNERCDTLAVAARKSLETQNM